MLSSWEREKIEIRQEGDRFKKNVADHEIQTLHDDGIYRHIRFGRPGTGIYRFDLVTWPGHLAISGDLESFMFARTQDMFEFFGPRHRSETVINPSYWAEKVVAGKDEIHDFNSDRFNEYVMETYDDFRNFLTSADAADLKRQLQDEVMDIAYNEQCAREALENFRFDVEYVADRPLRFEFIDHQQETFNSYSVHFIRALWAIVWGIDKYEQQIMENLKSDIELAYKKANIGSPINSVDTPTESITEELQEPLTSTSPLKKVSVWSSIKKALGAGSGT